MYDGTEDAISVRLVRLLVVLRGKAAFLDNRTVRIANIALSWLRCGFVKRWPTSVPVAL
ncbi:MAG TPA: hypothetical protein VJV23_15410 [Candidatus Polarisedimenticolia bacterium]|nr:hypothetical protein [Candidatus Polarisedimenticolia bacterium]